MDRQGTEEFLSTLRGGDAYNVEAAKLDFAMDLRRAMERSEISSAQLAERLGVSRPMVSKLLSGDSNVTIETMVKATRRVNGTLLIKIVRDGCRGRFFEIAQAEHGRGHVGRVRQRQIHGVDAGLNAIAFNDAGKELERCERPDEANAIAA